MQAAGEARFAKASDAPMHGERNAHSVRATETFLRVYRDWSTCRHQDEAEALHTPVGLPVEVLADRLPRFALEVKKLSCWPPLA